MYFKKIQNLDGMKAVHWSKMSVGDKYEMKIQAKTIVIYPMLKGVKKVRKVQWETFYLMPTSI